MQQPLFGCRGVVGVQTTPTAKSYMDSSVVSEAGASSDGSPRLDGALGGADGHSMDVCSTLSPPTEVNEGPSPPGRPVMHGACEAPHGPLLELREGRGRSGPCQVLRHVATGEIAYLPSRPKRWRLSVSGGLGYLYCNGESIWANSLLSESLWVDADGEQFVMSKAPQVPAVKERGKHEVTLLWLCEWRRRSLPRWVHFPAGPTWPALPCAKVVFEPAASSRRLWWDIYDWQVHAQMKGDGKGWLTQFTLVWRGRFRDRFGADDCNWRLRELVGVDKRWSTCATSCSTFVLLLLLVHWGARCENRVDSDLPLQLLVRLCSFAFASAELVMGQSGGASLGARSHDCAAIQWVDGELLLYDDIPGVGSKGQRVEAPQVLVRLYLDTHRDYDSILKTILARFVSRAVISMQTCIASGV